MEESSGYQLIMERGEAKGEVRGQHNLILDLGRLRFGEPEPDQLSTLMHITKLERLKEVGRRIITATTWDELLS